MRKGPGRSKQGGKRNPAGSKLARKFIEHTGNKWAGEIYHTGRLTQLAHDRALSNLETTHHA